MALLILFGFVAGAATALSPCVLPVLPIVLSAGATGGRRRPLGIVAGLAVSFTFATVALVYVISALGLPDDFLRKVVVVSLSACGSTVIRAPLAARMEATMSRFAGRAGVNRGGDGFWPGTAVAASLGLVYAPCAGPILAGVITVPASHPFPAGRLAVALSYGIGSAIVLYFLMLGGRRVTAPLARRGIGLQIAMGAVMIVAALAMLGNYDIKFQNTIASDLPSFLVNPSESLENMDGTRNALADIRGGSGGGLGEEAAGAAALPVAGAGPGSGLPVLGKAPEFVDNQQWFNTPGDRPLTLRSLRGHVALVDFWTYTCINCLRTLPYLTAWDRRFRKDGLTIVGVHSPEFPFEKEASNVKEAIERNDIRYPVAQDNDLATWSAYGNQYWPGEYFIGSPGRGRFAHFGEGSYGEKEKVIRELLAEAGKAPRGAPARVSAVAPSPEVTTPETYLGAARAERFVNPVLSPGSHDFGAPESPPADNFAYRGRWRIGFDSATAEGGTLDLSFGARRVYLVLGSPGHSRRMRVLLDGRPIPDNLAGADVKNGVVEITAQRLYDLVDLPKVENHTLRLEPET